MSHSITLIRGDGIGPEVVGAAVDIIEAVGVKVDWDIQDLGVCALEKKGNATPKESFDSIIKNKVALKGPTTTPLGGGHRSANVALRKELDLYACIRPVKSIEGVASRFRDVDIVVVRENTEGLYVGQELEIQPGCIISLRTTTKKASMRIAQSAFKFSKTYGRSKITCVHKANILKQSDGLFLQCAERVAQENPHVIYEQAIIDALCMRLVIEPEKFDVLLLENMFGDIVSDLCAGLIGGLGLVPGANIGDECAVFEAVHGSAPDIAGKNIANPCAMIQSAVMMLRYLGEQEAALKIESALLGVLKQKHLKTKDLGGELGTKEFTQNVIESLR
ncbi:MAG: isocitrate/isopropylmalate dehydrogenase family protein [Myxococcales bacterium]|nr:isocitrate/isopropylmalate dehydrogenase family protein [Myxococcales bacterium]USN49827.1 MAG: isocitrate/isopropylmalate dehydrogenase family protein [Myxococcales bacterium]